MNSANTPSRLPSIAALLMLVGVAAGAFGAHGLKTFITPERMAVWNTAVLYQLVHSLGILLLMPMHASRRTRILKRACQTMLFGTLIFSGSLYLLVLTKLSWLGAITPVGGVLFIIAWGMACAGLWPRRHSNH